MDVVLVKVWKDFMHWISQVFFGQGSPSVFQGFSMISYGGLLGRCKGIRFIQACNSGFFN